MEYQSVYGPIRLRWERRSTEVVVAAEVPLNTTAFVSLADGTEAQIGSGRPIFRYQNDEQRSIP